MVVVDKFKVEVIHVRGPFSEMGQAMAKMKEDGYEICQDDIDSSRWRESQPPDSEVSKYFFLRAKKVAAAWPRRETEADSIVL